MNLQPPLSPISPELVELEIPSVEEMIASYQGSKVYDQLAGQYFGGGSSSYAPPSPPSAPPGEGVFGAYSSYFYKGAGSSAAPPPYYPPPQPHRPSAAEQVAASAAASLFGPSAEDPYWMARSPNGGNGDGQ